MANMPRILVVEDDPLLQRTLCATLTLLGFIPYHAATVDEALEILGTQHIDAITLESFCRTHRVAKGPACRLSPLCQQGGV